MTQAEIITIGTELLLGEIQDTNTRHLARQLRQLGIDLFRVTTIGDNPLRIADMICESLSRADIVITTGGLGPTIDDPTRNAAAIAFNVEMVFHAELWKDIYHRFHSRGIVPSDNNRKQAFLPANAVAIDNPVGTAPAFYIADQGKLVVCLPGVPAEMETIFQKSVISLLQEQFFLHQLIKTRVIHSSGIGESVIDNLIADLEALSNPTVGLSAHPGCVDIRITAKAASPEEADSMIQKIEQIILARLPHDVYGFDDDTLMDKIFDLTQKKAISIMLLIFGFSETIFDFRNNRSTKAFSVRKLDRPFALHKDLKNSSARICFAFNCFQEDELITLDMYHICPEKQDHKRRQFNGAAPQLDKWIQNNCLDYIWRKLSEA